MSISFKCYCVHCCCNDHHCAGFKFRHKEIYHIIITTSKYIMGFIWDILGSALHGLIFALSELVFVKLLGRRSFHVVLEQQLMVSLFAFVFTTIGVIVSGDFQGMKSEAKSFKGGSTSYILVLIWSAITFQLGVLEAIITLSRAA